MFGVSDGCNLSSSYFFVVQKIHSLLYIGVKTLFFVVFEFLYKSEFATIYHYLPQIFVFYQAENMYSYKKGNILNDLRNLQKK